MTIFLRNSFSRSILSNNRRYISFFTRTNVNETFVTCNKLKHYKWQLRIALFNNLSSRLHTSSIHLKRRKTAEERKAPRMIEYSPKSKAPIMEVWRDITVSELASLFNRDVNYVRQLLQDPNYNANTMIEDVKLLQRALHRSGHRIQLIAKPKDETKVRIEKDAFPRPPAPVDKLEPRPPVVTVMGHVDHGKTTLLDALRHTNVVKQEFGGITQHIGAFNVVLESGARITFLDTPGHAAFSAMRERGANLTDVVVLVVAADDGVMEQTVESIRMARQANVPILVAINKIDSPKADIERTEKMLIQVGIQVESMGGDVQAIPISALKQKNLDKLTEALVLQAELLEVKADPTGAAEAVVVDSKVDVGRGRLCTVVVQRGTLKKGAVLVAGTSMGKVRALKDADGRVQKEVPPGYPVEIEGWKDLPPAGELVLEVESEKRAREVIKVREQKEQLEKQQKDAVIIAAKTEQHLKEYKDQLKTKRAMGRMKVKKQGPRKPEIQEDDGHPCLNIVVKGDVDGTLEAILDTLSTYHSHDCDLDVIHHGVGAITPNDIELAETFGGVIYAFNVNCTEPIRELAQSSKVEIKHFNVIYKLIDDVKEEINKRLPLKEVEEVVGEANVVQQFLVNEGKKKVPVAGCRCVQGVLKRNAKYRLVRGGQVVHEGALDSMRHLKNEVDLIKKDVECGLQLADKTVEFKPGDCLVCVETRMEPQKTDWDPGF